MSSLGAIVLGGLLMSAIALVGSVTLLFSEQTLDRILRPMVAFAAGSLLGGAFFHMLPAAAESGVSALASGAWSMAGFALFMALEQLLHYHHCRRASAECKQPLTYLILLGDGLHNLIGGLGVGSVMLVDTRLGLAAWAAAAAHEIPQELGDFAVLVHGGWGRRRALLFNLLSGLMFLVGGLIAYVVSVAIDLTILIPFAAGNFIYIGASDLVPEVNRHSDPLVNGVQYLAFLVGLGLLLWLRLQLGGHA